MHITATKSPSGASPVGVRPKLQPKLRIGAVDDPLEREADRIADAVLSGEAPLGVGAAKVGSVQRACAECEEESLVQRKATGNGTGVTSAAVGAQSHDSRIGSGLEHSPEQSVDLHVSRALGSSGSPLPEPTSAFFSQRFGYDFSHVRIHTDEAANSSAQALGARAYTLGNHVVFGNGEYAPGHRDGQRLIAHELTHVVQQSGSPGVVRRQRRRRRWAIEDASVNLIPLDASAGSEGSRDREPEWCYVEGRRRSDECHPINACRVTGGAPLFRFEAIYRVDEEPPAPSYTGGGPLEAHGQFVFQSASGARRTIAAFNVTGNYSGPGRPFYRRTIQFESDTPGMLFAWVRVDTPSGVSIWEVSVECEFINCV